MIVINMVIGFLSAIHTYIIIGPKYVSIILLCNIVYNHTIKINES